MDLDDAVLSEVHLETVTPAGPADQDVVTEFVVRLPGPLSHGGGEAVFATTAAASVDDDGDLVLPRRKHHEPAVAYSIHHAMATPLSDVGLQVCQPLLPPPYQPSVPCARI
eukprot:m.534 g.534  ORF g.534 m.534 type:complete len:111 (-) comp214_c0_seq2:107-439(-)